RPPYHRRRRRRHGAAHSRQSRRHPGRLPLRRPEAPPRPRSPARRQAPNLAARRTDRLPRCREPRHRRQPRRSPHQIRRHGHRRNPPAARSRWHSHPRTRRTPRTARRGRGMSAFTALLKRDLTLTLREGSALGTALGFYLIVVAMMPLGLGPDLPLLNRIAPGVLWIALLLAALLSAPRIFEADNEDGSLEAISLSNQPLELIALAKITAHWLTMALPLVLCAPVL